MTPTGDETPTRSRTSRQVPEVVDPEAAGAGPDDGQAPPSYDNPELVKRLVQRCIDDAASNPARKERDMADMYNLRFYRGGPENQYLYRSPTSDQWEQRPFDGDFGIPAWCPRPTSNDFANRIDGIVSLLVSTDPAKVITPATSDDEDIAAADVAQRGLPVCEEEIGWPSLKRQISHLVALTNGVAVVYYYDNDPKHGTAELPVYRCPECAQDPQNAEGGLLEPVDVDDDDSCPHCGAPIEVAMDPTTPGKPLTLTYARGKLCADLANGYGYSLPSAATTHDAQKNPWVLLHNGIEVDTACGRWPKHAPYLREQSQAGKKMTPTSQHAEDLRTMAAPSATQRTGGTTGTHRSSPLTIYRLQHDPIVEGEFNFPEGLYAVMCGERVLEAGPLPIEDSRTGRRRKTILIRTFREMPGSQYGKPPADDLAPLQGSLNMVQVLAFLTAMHHASPTVFLPDTVTLIDQITNQPGQTVRFRSHDGQKPTIAQGSGPHASLYELWDRYQAQMDKESNLNAVLQGARPKGGDPTLGEVQILQEQGQQAFRTPLDVALDFEKEQAILLLDFARQCMWTPRFRKILGDDGQWDVEQFLGSDLTGNVDITIDRATAWPRSPMMQDLRLGKAVELGVLAPAQDPEVAGKVLEDWSLGDYKKSLGVDRKQIARELDRWRAATSGAEIAPPDLAAIEVPIHLFHKRQFLKSELAEQIKAANPPVYQAIVAHVQMLQQAMMPPAPPAPGDGKPAPGAGNAIVDAAVQAGALVPEGAQPAAPNPLEAALQSGALVPEGAQPQQPTGPSMDQLLDAQLLAPAPPEVPAP